MKKVLTILIDGFGMRGAEENNAVADAKMHVFNDFFFSHPHTLLDASSEEIGLVSGEASTCEFSFKTMGAGKKLISNQLLINDFLLDDEIDNDDFKNMISDLTKNFHIITYTDDIDIEFSLKLYDKLIRKGIKKIYFHLICRDGDNLEESIKKLTHMFKETHIGNIISVCGNDYVYAPEDNLYYESDLIDTVVKGNSQVYNSLFDIVTKISASNLPYNKVRPFLLYEKKLIKNEDIVFIVDYAKISSKQFVHKIYSVCENLYSFLPMSKDNESINFLDDNVSNITLGKYLSKLDIKQARISSDDRVYLFTEYFDNERNGIELIGLPVNNENYEANCVDITHKTIALMVDDYDFIVANFSMPNTFASLGDYDRTVKACMSVDICLGKLIEEAENNFYTVIITSDHGNAENMDNCNNTLSQVPFVINDDKVTLKENGSIASFAPTILDYMDISIPDEMSSESLIN